MTLYSKFSNTQRIRVSAGQTASLTDGCVADTPLLFLVWPQLGDFDSLEYAWWIKRNRNRIRHLNLQVRAIGIGDRRSGQEFCKFTGFPESELFVDPQGLLHQELGLYPGLSLKMPGFSQTQNAWINLLLMCAGIGSPGTLSEVWRGYRGDRTAPQLIETNETVKAPPLPAIQGQFFDRAGGSGFQRPFELATLRLRNMIEVLGKWRTYVPDPAYITQRGGTFLFNRQRQLIYEFRDSGILGFSETMNTPLAYLWDNLIPESSDTQSSLSPEAPEIETSR